MKKEKEQINMYKKASKMGMKKSTSKVPAIPSKKYDLNNLRRKWKAEMDKYIAKYK